MILTQNLVKTFRYENKFKFRLVNTGFWNKISMEHFILVSYWVLNFFQKLTCFKVRLVIELIICFYSLLYMIILANEIYAQHWMLFVNNLFANPTKIFFYISIICIVVVVIARFLCNHVIEDYFSVLGIISMIWYFLYFGR